MFGWFKGPRAAPAPAPRDLEAQAQARAQALRTQGNQALEQGDLQGAAACYREACVANPRDANAWLNLGFVLKEQGQVEPALQALAQATQIDPFLGDAHYLLGQLHVARQDAAQALACWRQALMVQPDFPECRRDLCVALAQSGQIDEARAVLDAGRSFPEDSPDLYFLRGNLHLVQNQFDAAIVEFEKAVALDPSSAAGLTNLGLAQFKQGDVFAAAATYRRALDADPANVLAWCNLGGAAQIQGRLDAAADCYARAIQLDPGYVPAHHNRLYALSFDAQCAPEAYLREARHSGEVLSAPAVPYSDWLSDRDARPLAPLRVGMVSGDLRNHVVGAFLEGVVAHIDPAKVSLVAYATRAGEDQTTERLRPFFAEWNTVHSLSDAALAARIHDDRIDILVDLAGHTAHNRLPVFAWRPAPVQVAWLGFFATTGLPAMDYIVVDPVSVPDAGRSLLSEKPVFLPDTRLCFTEPVTGRPLPVGPLPALRNGYVTFGSFQIYSKLSDAALAAWARVLQQVPSARLRLQSWQLGFEGARSDLLRRLQAVGLAAGRVDLHGGALRDDYLAAHGEVDLILDTFPFPGGTTTAEALWMGVPTVTRSGVTLLQRQGHSLLTCAGLADWVAEDDDSFVALAVAKAQDLPALAALRQSLRARVLASPLYDAGLFARHLEAAFERMWQDGRDQEPAKNHA